MYLKRNLFLSILAGFFLIASGCQEQSDKGKTPASERYVNANSFVNVEIIPSKNQKIGQIHGIGYPGNDHALYVATNEGLKYYRGSRWLETSANQHNYLSFQAVDAGYLASGHPEKKTGFKDPLGIVESVDQGVSLKKLAFYGESNLHFLSASYFGNGIYIINEKPVGKMVQGVYYSTDSGKNWGKCSLVNFTADSLGMIAVHAKINNIMAMATRTGIFYSEDYGNSMKAVTGPVMITALVFDGDTIIYSSVEDKKILLKKVNPKTGEQTNIIFPFLDYDNPVTYLAVDPKHSNKLAFATYKNDLYESVDGGRSWNNLLSDGRIEQD